MPPDTEFVMPPAPHPAIDAPPRALAVRLAFAAWVGLVAFGLAFTPLRASHDEWWHLKTGQWIDERGLPENEIFTYTAESFPWHNHEWASQLLLWRTYAWGAVSGFGGIRAVILLKALVVAATFAGLALYSGARSGATATAALAGIVGADLARRTLYPRPPFLSYAGLAATLIFFFAWRDGRLRSRWLVVLPPAFALWSNFHGGFIAGLVVVGAFCMESLVAWGLALWRKEDPREARIRGLAATATLVACTGATLLNPSGIHLYLLVPRVMNSEILTSTIAELQPPDWRFVWAADGFLAWTILCALRPRSARSWGAGVAAIAVAAAIVRLAPALVESPDLARFLETKGRIAIGALAIGFAGGRCKERLGLAPTMLVLFFWQQSVSHVRHLPLLGVVAVPFLAEAAAAWPRRVATAWDAEWIGPQPAAARDHDSALDRARAKLAVLARRWETGALAACAAATLYLALCPGEGANLLAAPDRDARTRALSAPSILDLNVALARGTELQPGAYPVEAVDFLLAHAPPGRLFNGGNYAGYLIWRLSPEKYKVFTDNRYDIYGDRFVREEKIVLSGFEGDAEKGIPSWREVLEKWEVRTLFVPVDSGIQAILPADGGWWEIWRDGSFAIWTRAD